MKKIKILFLAANPQNTSTLKLDEEIRKITEKIRASEYRERLELVSAWAVRPDDLIQLLNMHRPDIVHFSGHGSPLGEIILVDKLGQAKPVSAKAIQALFTTLKDNIRVVILNACYSKLQAQMTNNIIDFVIGMNAGIGDQAAIIFAASFYRAIGFERTIQEAFDQATTALLLEGISEDTTPELLVKAGASAAQKLIIDGELTIRSLQDMQQQTRSPNDRSQNFTHTESVRGNTHSSNLGSDWEAAPDSTVFLGRTEELATLEHWIVVERCRLLAILGIRGIGKTELAINLARGCTTRDDLLEKFKHGIQGEFEYVVWRQLLNAPPLTEVLHSIVRFISGQQEVILPDNTEKQILRLIHHLQTHRCLLILDNLEAILEEGESDTGYREGYELYSNLLYRIGSISHQSCVIITSREKPREIGLLEGKSRPVRSLELKGLSKTDGRGIFDQIGTFSGSDHEWSNIVEFYGGNPLALELVAKHVNEVFFGDISAFFKQGNPIFYNLNDLLIWHFDRLSYVEKEVMYWLAINREPISFAELREDLLSDQSKDLLSSTLQSLQRKLPLNKSISRFTIQPVLIEFLTKQMIEQLDDSFHIGGVEILDFTTINLIKQVSQNLKLEQINILNTHALLKASAKEYIRESQIRLILKPIVGRLTSILGTPEKIGEHLRRIIAILRETAPLTPGYAAGNILNFLCYLGVDLSGYDFSNLCVWQADLQKVSLHGVNFAHADVTKSKFTDTFGGVNAVAFNPQDHILAAGTFRGEIRLWHTVEKKYIQNLQGHLNCVTSLAFNSNGKLLASSSHDLTIRVWDVDTGQTIVILSGHTDAVSSVAFSPDGRLLASGSNDQTIRLWDIASGENLQIMRGHTGWVMSVAFNSDGRILASAGEDCTICLWDIRTAKVLKTLIGHTGKVRAVTFSPNSNLLATGSSDQTVRLWDSNTGICIRTLEGHTDRVRTVSFTPTGKYLASGSNDTTLRIWNVASGQCIQTLQGHANWVESVAFDAKGEMLAGGSSDQTVTVWEVDTGHCIVKLHGHLNPVRSVAFSPDGHMLANGNDNETVQIWDVESSTCSNILRGHTNWIWSVAFSPDSKLVASASGDKSVRIWDSSTGRCLNVLSGHTNRVRTVVFSPNSNILASGGGDRTIRIWNVSTGQCINILHGHINWVQAITFSPDGRLLVSASTDQTIRIWDLNLGQCIKTLIGHTDWVMSVAFSLDGVLLASASNDRTVRLWETTNWTHIGTLHVDINKIGDISFSPTAPILAIGGESGLISLWDVNTRLPIKELQGHVNRIWALSFRTDGILASSSEDETIRIWNVLTGQCLRTINSNRPYERMNIMGIAGLTKAQKTSLKLLGAIENIVSLTSN